MLPKPSPTHCLEGTIARSLLSAFIASFDPPTFSQCSRFKPCPKLATSQYAGKSKFNPIYEFAFQMPPGSEQFVNGKQVTMKISSVAGHIFESEFESEWKHWKSCSPAKLLTAEAKIRRFIPEVTGIIFAFVVFNKYVKNQQPNTKFTLFFPSLAEI